MELSEIPQNIPVLNETNDTLPSKNQLSDELEITTAKSTNVPPVASKKPNLNLLQHENTKKESLA